MQTFSDKTILITGGTGSFGHAFLDYLLEKEFGEIRIFSRDELKQEHMRLELGNPKVRFYIGDVRERDSVIDAMRGVDYVFHAAALKQVPSCEFFPMQAVSTNVIGSHNVVEGAVTTGVKRLICLGTDKAVYPVNAMGITKALMEKVAQSVARTVGEGATTIASVRYGNVMCSRGSVIPLFMKQIKAGHSVTVTENDMTRFLLPLSDAIKLVVHAFEQAEQGDIFVRKAPACTIEVLVQALGQLFDRQPEVKVIGMRHGEKLHETLVSREELLRSEDMGEYYRIKMDGRDLNYSKYFTKGNVTEAVIEDYTSENTVQLSVSDTVSLLKTLPEVMAELPGSS
ncbi:MAG: polysaccharide biosynthesis protein [Pseudomonadota bacterium]